MPEPDDNGLPTVTVTWLATSEPFAYTDSFVHETTMSSSASASESISDYRRAKVDWPGAKAAVLSTWTESVPLQDGSELTVDAELFFVDSDGAAFQVFVIAPSGELAGSTADEVLRSLDLG